MTIDRRRFLAGAGLTAAASGVRGTAGARSPAETDAPRDWRAVREQFDLTPDYVHLGLFFITAHPRPVREAIERHRRGMDKNPLLYAGGHMHLEAAAQRAAAEYLGAEADEVALTDSTTMGLALVYHGLPLRAGQEILTTEHDHYSTHESARLAAERAGATLRKIPLYDRPDAASEDEIVARVARALTPRTRAVGVTWVHSSSGVKLPVRSIAGAVAEANRGRAEEDRAFLVVDGVHGFGVEDEQAAQTGCDFFVAGCHKWMFGPRGTGVVWAKRETWKQMRPTIPAFTGGPLAAWMRGEAPPRGEM
jgi:selenocysteine lyase/cysteine desulfurase